MKKSDYKDTTAIAYVEGESLEVVGIEYGIEDLLIVRDRDNNKVSKIKIYYANNPYVNYLGRRISLDNMIRLQ